MATITLELEEYEKLKSKINSLEREIEKRDNDIEILKSESIYIERTIIKEQRIRRYDLIAAIRNLLKSIKDNRLYISDSAIMNAIEDNLYQGIYEQSDSYDRIYNIDKLKRNSSLIFDGDRIYHLESVMNELEEWKRKYNEIKEIYENDISRLNDIISERDKQLSNGIFAKIKSSIKKTFYKNENRKGNI